MVKNIKTHEKALKNLIAITKKYRQERENNELLLVLNNEIMKTEKTLKNKTKSKRYGKLQKSMEMMNEVMV